MVNLFGDDTLIFTTLTLKGPMTVKEIADALGRNILVHGGDILIILEDLIAEGTVEYLPATGTYRSIVH